MEKFEAAKLFLKMLNDFPQDFVITTNTDCYFIKHIKTDTRVNISVSSKVHSYVADSSTDLNYVDSDTAHALAIFARDTIERQREQERINKDNELVYNITMLYA